MELHNWPIEEEISGRLYMQALQFINALNEKEKKDFLSLLMQVMVKVQSLKYHLNEYQNKEECHIQHVITENNPHVTVAALDLLYELEAFLFQLKSSLDLSVKFFDVLFPGRFRVQTFGNKGNDLIKGLEKFKKQRGVRVATVDSIISMIQEDQKKWLTTAVKLRDDVAHYKTFLDYHYRIQKDGEKTFVYPPVVSGMSVFEFMNLIYKNSLDFIQDFMCLAIELSLPAVFIVGLTTDPLVEEPYKKYIKFGLGFNNLTAENA